MGARTVLSLILCLGLVACGGGAPSTSPTPRAAVATASPAPTLTPTPIATTVPATPTPTPTSTPPPTWTKRERAIRNAIRDDARVDCAPRRHDLPPGTIAAVECRPGMRLVSQVGFYLFATNDEAFDVYRKRIRDQGLRLEEVSGSGWEGPRGECAAEYEGGHEEVTLACRDRQATFVNSSGFANYRAVAGRLYVGVLGTNGNVDALAAWARGVEEPDTGTIPGQNLWCDGGAPAARLPLCLTDELNSVETP